MAFGLYASEIVTNCHTHNCYERASHYLGYEDSPNGTVYYVCAKCASELKEQVIGEAVKVKEPLPFEPSEEDFAPEPEDKVVPLEELSYLKLKAIAKEMKIEGYSTKNKDELIVLIKQDSEPSIEYVVEE